MVKSLMGVACGATIASAGMAFAQVYATVDTNGVLKNYIVQDRKGREVCRDPWVQNQFRGKMSYINCSK